MDADWVMRMDAEHVWHPYGAFPPSTASLPVVSAAGVRLTLADGSKLIDGMSSWWAAIHGYRHPALDAAAHRQIDTVSHVMFGGLTHEPAARLCQNLVELTAKPLDKVFLADSGSVSVEVATKMAIQYQRAVGRPGRTRLMTWRGGYHGDTLTPMGVCDPDGGMHSLWTGVVNRQVFADLAPTTYERSYVEHLETTLGEHAHEVAAIIVEPVVQGAGGMRFPHPGYLADLRRICDQHGVLLIFDEIATGFGRTGTMFAYEHGVSYNNGATDPVSTPIVPDILCVGKALTGGYLTLAATLTTTELAHAISAGEGGGLMHGPTFMGNPLACSVANASIEVLREGSWASQIPAISSGLRDGLAPAMDIDGVREVRTLGAIGVIELDHPVHMQRVTDAVVQQGVWIRPFRNLIYCMPPYVSTTEDIAAITAAMCSAAQVSSV